MENTIIWLRNDIISRINKKPECRYFLTRLLWDDAADIAHGSDCVDIFLDLHTKEIIVEASSYPNQFGACRETRFNMSAHDFAAIVEKYQGLQKFRCLKTESDWAKLFDDRLIDAIRNADALIEEREKQEKEAERLKYAVRISSKFLENEPKFDIESVELLEIKRFADSAVTIKDNGNTYHVDYRYTNTWGNISLSSSKDTSTIESVWLENQIKNAIASNDNTIIKSLSGGDRMKVMIRFVSGETIITEPDPLEKYSFLSSQIRLLAIYGSITE